MMKNYKGETMDTFIEGTRLKYIKSGLTRTHYTC